LILIHLATQEVTMMKRRSALLIILVVAVLVGAGSYVVWLFQPEERDSWGAATVTPARPTAVASNRGPDVPDGFRGNVHPVLFGHTRMEVTAHWSPVGPGRDQLHVKLKSSLYATIKGLQPNEPKRTYTESDFSAFLPETIGEAGQCWALDDAKIIRILTQFHPNASLQLVAAGRRAGPDGAFGILRAVSPDYLDIGFRIHAEFELTPADWLTGRPQIRAWYTPASLTGTLLVNRKTGTVDYFQLAMPTEKSLNVHLTVEIKDVNLNRQARDVVRVDHMELTGGNGGLARNIQWTKALSPIEADRRLAGIFYKFLDINWIPFDQVAARAHSRGQPIMAVVSWGAFDDQSC
jgi:hypothetical protein